ncbi:Clavaminate synthase-like protein [Artomyces pyxidatus]|uniref:Clavaminate synthase-like protein n=1 Tax=Artomyces pyxidatus TaxID=48021 RepID=A0ACB8TKZ8_9AGAM|nr:Clavaminate synthase-like protein [Artomyces pyxidatus]
MMAFKRLSTSLNIVRTQAGPSTSNRRQLATSSLTIPSLNATFPYRWLRDSCQCPECVHPTTFQKLHRTTDIPSNLSPNTDGVRITQDGVHVEWTSGHQSFYPSEFLARYASPAALAAFHRDTARVPWDRRRFVHSGRPSIGYEELQMAHKLKEAIEQLAQYGLMIVEGVPNIETSDERCEARMLAKRLGELRWTFYGEAWDVKNVVNSRNIAYTNLYLGLHMDLQYFEHPPRYQVLHCLRNRVKGGASLFVDALHAANIMRERYPADFDILASTPVPFHYVNDGHHLHYSHPTIQLTDLPDRTSGRREIAYVNYSPPFQAPLPPSTPPEFYAALERFAAELDAPGVTFEYTLKETDAVVFDNRRVLHARTAFEDAADAGGEEKNGPNRWLKGCYFEADMMMDHGRVLKEKAEKGEL